MNTYIGLIRGINVGGNKVVKMADLRQMLQDMGFDDPKTLLQSGNFVIRSADDSPEVLRERIQLEAKAKLGLEAEFFIFTPGQWSQIIANNPFPDAAAEHPSRLAVYLGRKPLSDADLLPIESYRIPSERVRAIEGVVYLDCPDGLGTSKMLSSSSWCKLTAAGTLRNWNTVLKLATLAEE